MRDHVREPYRDDTPHWRTDSRGVAQTICLRQRLDDARGITMD
jgi:hypothetical protein